MSKSMQNFKLTCTYYSLKYSRTIVNYAISEIEAMMSDKGINYITTDQQLDFITNHLNDQLLQGVHQTHMLS